MNAICRSRRIEIFKASLSITEALESVIDG